MEDAFWDFDEIISHRKQDSDNFYANIQKDIENEDEKNVQRQAFAGLLWNKQFYHYNVGKWLKGVYPVSTGIIVQGLAKPEYMMEIDIIAEIPT